MRNKISSYNFHDIPLYQEVYVSDQTLKEQYIKNIGEYFEGGYPQDDILKYRVKVIAISIDELELDWYVNLKDRYHSVTITLPKSQYDECLKSFRSGDKPRIFVQSSWLASTLQRKHSIFALVDAINVKQALKTGELNRDALISLRSRIDDLASFFNNISFISFADSLILKANWTFHDPFSTVSEYEPEIFIDLVKKINEIFFDSIGLNTYAVISQGTNEYYDDELLHVSSNQNHVCLNSLGTPFAQLLSIESTARDAIRSGKHLPFELYLDEQFYKSLKFRVDFDHAEILKFNYPNKMALGTSNYLCINRQKVLSNLEYRNRFNRID